MSITDAQRATVVGDEVADAGAEEQARPVPAKVLPRFDLLAWLDSLPAGTRTPEEWQEWEREFQRERDSWGR